MGDPEQGEIVYEWCEACHPNNKCVVIGRYVKAGQ